MFKKIGMFLFVVGIGISASFATKNTPQVNKALSIKHRASLAAKLADKAHGAYCAAASKSLTETPAEALSNLATGDGCVIKGVDPKAEEPASDAPASPTLPGHVGIWRQSVSPWDRDASRELDSFLELMPNGQATLFDVTKQDNQWTPRVTGDYVVNRGTVTIALCGVGNDVDLGCSTAVYQLNGPRLNSHRIKVSTGKLRVNRNIEFVRLERSPELLKKYNYQVEHGAALAKRIAASAGIELSEDLTTLRRAWLDGQSVSIAASSAQAGKLPPTPAGLRFTRWFRANAPGFLFGLLLVIIGGFMSRKALRDEAMGTGQDGDGVEVVDFGELLNEVTLSIAAHGQEMKSILAPTPGDHERIIAYIDKIKLTSVERLVESRARLQIVHGVAGYAMVFGPFAKGERYLNRCWSALVDDHWPEGTDSMRISAEAFAEAKAELDKLIEALEAA